MMMATSRVPTGEICAVTDCGCRRVVASAFSCTQTQTRCGGENIEAASTTGSRQRNRAAFEWTERALIDCGLQSQGIQASIEVNRIRCGNKHPLDGGELTRVPEKQRKEEKVEFEIRQAQ